MQNRYTGDVGDFGKYGLLKVLCGFDLKLGVVWYLVPDEDHNNDGKYTSYLLEENRNRYRLCDPDLYDGLGGIVNSGRRSVGGIKRRGLLPEGTVYFEGQLAFSDMPTSGAGAREKRLVERGQWLDAALNATQGCDVVFLDPDNGLEVKSVRAYENKGPKYVFFDELVHFINRGQSLVVYQHLGRRGKPLEQIRYRLRQVWELSGTNAKPWAVRFCRGSARAFLIIPNSAHEKILLNRTKAFLQTPWSGHFQEKIIHCDGLAAKAQNKCVTWGRPYGGQPSC